MFEQAHSNIGTFLINVVLHTLNPTREVVLTNLCIPFSILQGTKISFYLLSLITERHSLWYAF